MKFKYSSGTLSHLFAQGKISCNLIASDDEFRKELRQKFKQMGIPMNVMPEKQEDLDTHDYTVTFAIIADGQEDFAESLPFFSLLNLRLTMAELRRLNFRVKVKKIRYA